MKAEFYISITQYLNRKKSSKLKRYSLFILEVPGSRLHCTLLWFTAKPDQILFLTVIALCQNRSIMDQRLFGHTCTPIEKEYTQNDVDVIHFLSDSPATQYRNKQMFSFITNQFMEHFPILIIIFGLRFCIHSILTTPQHNKLYMESIANVVTGPTEFVSIVKFTRPVSTFANFFIASRLPLASGETIPLENMNNPTPESIKL
nr:unnamed protein product [Callosobruchus analis]